MIYFTTGIMWMVYAVMMVTSFLYIRPNNQQLLGITFSQSDQQKPEVVALLKQFKRSVLIVFVGSIIVSVLLMHDIFYDVYEVVMIVSFMLNISLNWILINSYQNKLEAYKKAHDLYYHNDHKVRVDLGVLTSSKEGKISSTYLYVMLILSLVPLLIHDIPLIARCIGPIIMLFPLYVYYKQVPPSHLNTDSKINVEMSIRINKIQSISATLIGLLMLVFYLILVFGAQKNSPLLLFIGSGILMLGITLIAVWQTRQIREVESVSGEDYLQDTSKMYRWGAYYNPNDKRLFVPKRVSSMGMTINAAHPLGKALMASIILLILWILIFLGYSTFSDYKYQIDAQQIVIDAPMYDRSINKEDIVSIEKVNSIPQGIRSNGFGGLKKNFGHFSLDTYGNVMLYIYNDVDNYIIVKTKDQTFIFNDTSVDATDTLYDDITAWLK